MNTNTIVYLQTLVLYWDDKSTIHCGGKTCPCAHTGWSKKWAITESSI